MRTPQGRVVRPTLRCLIEDLGQEIGPASLRAALASAERDMDANPHYLFPVPLSAAEHIVLDKANMLAQSPAAERQRIETITDLEAIKVKTADRRGALWQDEEGVWWLLAAGRRKDDGTGDFYRDLTRFKRNSDPITPTEQDRRYHRFENAYIAEHNAERAAQSTVLRALLDAAGDPCKAQSITVFGARIAICFDPDENGTDMLSLSFDFLSFEERDRFPIDIIGFVPGYESVDDWDILPPLRPGDPECWYTYVSEAWVEWLATAAELDRLVEGWQASPASPVPATNDRSHLAPASVVTLAYVEGVEITALCGMRFTPHRNPDRFPECPACADALALLRKGLSNGPKTFSRCPPPGQRVHVGDHRRWRQLPAPPHEPAHASAEWS